jgi:hypothetical protein
MAKFGNPFGEGNEVWSTIKDYEGLYEVSNMGRVRSLDREQSRAIVGLETYIKKGQVLSPRLQRQGYQLVALFKNGKREDKLIHRIVAEAFIPNPLKKETVNHKDNVKGNNVVNNLEWATQSENSKHAFDNGFNSNKGEKNPSRKLNNKDVRRIKMALGCGISARELGNIYNVHKSTIKSIRTGRNWKHIKLFIC